MTSRQKGHKYKAQPTVVDGVRFASKKESRRYLELKLLEKAKAIDSLELQPSFDLVVPSHVEAQGLVKIGRYRADFRYWDNERKRHVIEDVKSAGTKTTAYRLRKRMVEAIYGIDISEV